MAAADVNSATKLATLCEAVDPCNLIRPIRALFRKDKELIKTHHSYGFCINKSRFNRLQLHFYPGGQPSKTEATDRGGKKLGIFFSRKRKRSAIRARKAKPTDVAAERAVKLVIFAVHIVCDQAT